MISITTLYSTQEDFLNFLEQNNFNKDSKCFIRIYSAICTPDEAVEIAKEIKNILSNCYIMGSSGSGVIKNGQQYNEHTLVIIEDFKHSNISISTYNYDSCTGHDMAVKISKTIDGIPSITHMLCGNHYYDVSAMIDALNHIAPHLKFIGGVVGDILPKNIDGYIFNHEGYCHNGIITASIYGDQLHIYNGVNKANEAISPVYTVNKTEQNWILEIENKSAVSWCREQIGMESLQEYNDWQLIAENDALVRFPMILEDKKCASRFIKYDSIKGEMSLYFSKIENGTRFRIGYTSPTKCVQECFDMCSDISSIPAESLFCYTCLFRKLYLGNCAEWELRPFEQYGICGVFMMGELCCIDGKNEFLNGANSTLTMADCESYITPDFSVFEDLYKIKDDNKKLHNFILQKQSAAMSRENRELMEKLLEQQEKSKAQLYIDINTDIPNTIKFAEDNQSHVFDKLCMIHIENSHLIMSMFGQKHYYSLLKKAVEQMNTYTSSFGYPIFYYILNENTIFIAANFRISELYFMDVIRGLYDKYQFINMGTRDDLFINRFIIVLNQKNMLEKALSTLQSSKNLQTHFVICDSSTDNNQSIIVEMEMLQILNKVIANRWLIPYFQGIYDNSQDKINKYEALMRIYDENDKIYPPFAFMEIAKKYHLYSSLSRIMLDKVFTLFGNTDIEVSINLSAYDINFDSMRTFIFDWLDKLKDASNFVFEILEDENFRDMEILKVFISKAREYGVKIAIDDFGSGYSNFMEIAKIQPDFIKIDASIVKNINTNDMCRKVLANIAFLGNQLDALLVAEFVENEEIQKCLKPLGIHFSQGYYFARPVPYSELKLNN